MPLQKSRMQKLVPRSARRGSQSQHGAPNDGLLSAKDLLLSATASRIGLHEEESEDTRHDSAGPLHPPASGFGKSHYVSRSLSAQVEAIERLFPTGNKRRSQSEDLTSRRLSARSPGATERDEHSSQKPSQSGTGSTSMTRPPKQAARRAGHVNRMPPDGGLFPSLDYALNHIAPPHQARKPRKHSALDSWPKRPCSPILEYGARRCSLSRKPDVVDLRRASTGEDIRIVSLPVFPYDHDKVPAPTQHRGHLNLNKPLPPLPPEAADIDAQNLSSRARPPHVRFADPAGPSAPRLTIDTTTYKRWLPAVTHETRTRQVHHVREEKVMREIESHHYQYRVLPITDVEVLPTRHFVPADGGGYVEVSAEDVPAALTPMSEEIASEAVSRLLSSRSSSRPVSCPASSLETSRPLHAIPEQAGLGQLDTNESSDNDQTAIIPVPLDQEQGRSILLRIQSCGNRMSSS